MQINCAHKCQVCDQTVVRVCVCVHGKYRSCSNKLLLLAKVSSPRKIIASTQQNASQNFLAPPFAPTLVLICMCACICVFMAFVVRLCQ